MRRLSVVLLVAVAVAGCKKKEPAAPVVAGAEPAADAGAAIKGKVLERLDAPPYSYLRLQTDKGEAWAAVPRVDAAAGTEVTVQGAMPMAGFESKTLKRKFDLVYFGTLAGAGGQAAPAGMPPAGMGGMGGPMGAEAQGPGGMAAQHAAAAAGPADVGDVKVPKASGADARTVAEIYAQRSALKEKSVTLRGKVVKFNAGIMNRNWVHLRDGTGAAGKDNDLTVTTNDSAAVGDVVVVKGTVRLDKDFGAGYAYPVILEDAKITK
ncbi:MAG TPA: nucleotide-binding protein [Anaeromyxobacter sp.]